MAGRKRIPGSGRKQPVGGISKAGRECEPKKELAMSFADPSYMGIAYSP
jgi:hypothetical protein